MKQSKPHEPDRAFCPSCNRAWVDHPGLKQTCEEREELQKESDEFRALSILLNDLNKRLIVERDELLEILKLCEWATRSDRCPICGEERYKDHKPDCRLIIALEGERV